MSKAPEFLESNVFLQPSIFMQRVGHVRLLLDIARVRRRTSFERLAAFMTKSLIDARVASSDLPHDNVATWIEKRQQKDKYPGFRSGVVPDKVQFQDAYLSDPNLPSFTGSLTAQVTNEIVRWAVHLGVLKKEIGALSSLGDTLNKIDRLSLDNGFKKYSPNANPYLLRPPGAAIAWALVVVASDLKVLSLLFRRFPADDVFDRSAAGDMLLDVLLRIQEEMKEEGKRNLQARKTASSLAGMITAMEKQRGLGSRGVREHVVAVRLEPMADFGFLRKPDPYRWQYTLPSVAQAAWNTDDVLEAWPKVGLIVAASGLQLVRTEEAREIWDFLYRGFLLAKSPVGFAGIGETVLCALAYSGNEGKYFEWDVAVSTIEKAREAAPSEIRFNVDRFGKPRHVRLTQDMPV